MALLDTIVNKPEIGPFHMVTAGEKGIRES
jgi:hypothetical protein